MTEFNLSNQTLSLYSPYYAEFGAKVTRERGRRAIRFVAPNIYQLLLEKVVKITTNKPLLLLIIGA